MFWKFIRKDFVFAAEYVLIGNNVKSLLPCFLFITDGGKLILSSAHCYKAVLSIETKTILVARNKTTMCGNL